MDKNPVVLCLFLMFALSMYGQESKRFEIIWNEPIKIAERKTLSFEDAAYDHQYLPTSFQKLAVKHINITAQLTHLKFEEVTEEEAEILYGYEIDSDFRIESQVFLDRMRPYLALTILPIRYNQSAGQFEKLMSYELGLVDSGANRSVRRSATAHQSKMSEGNWVKLGVTKTGVHKITYNELQNLGITSFEDIRVYGYGGKTMPERNEVDMPDDMQELPILLEKGNDGVFGNGDYVLFYAEGPITWDYNKEKKAFEHNTHMYSDTIFYFLSSGTGFSKTIIYKNEQSSFENEITCFMDRQVHELDKVNILKSGRDWFGEEYRSIEPSHNFDFHFSNIIKDSIASVEIQSAARFNKKIASFSYLKTYYNSENIFNVKIGGVNTASFSSYFFKKGNEIGFIQPSGSHININTRYDRADSFSAWLDYIRVCAVRELKMGNSQQVFANIYKLNESNRFMVQNVSSAYQVWNITDISGAYRMHTEFLNNKLYFNDKNSDIQTYCVFKPSNVHQVVSFQKVANQNLHGLENIEYVILSPQSFKYQAEKIANYHRTTTGLNVAVVTNEQVYNEFSSGTPDITAVKNFMRHLYQEKSLTDTLKYLLLFADGSYDNKSFSSSGNNMILTYQTPNSIDISNSYTTDDYYALLDDLEGNDVGFVDIGVGRIVASNKEQANNAVNKILNYSQPRETYGKWRTDIAFLADNGDGNTYVDHADSLSGFFNVRYPRFNVNKIYMDAYPLEHSAGVNIVPEMNKAIDNQVNRGALIVNYVGHGGITGLSDEQVVTVASVLSWKNTHRLPFFITATCQFTRFDNHETTSAGEFVFLNEKGGGIGLLTTSRIAYGGSNFRLNNKFYMQLFDDDEFRLGDLARRTKNLSGSLGLNVRGFVLIGDPALRLAIPSNNISTVKVNNVSISEADTIQISALSKVTVEGEIRGDNAQKLSDFNGSLYSTVYDKQDTVETLCQFGCNKPFPFMIRKNIIYKGKASVKNGVFKFSFMVPKDISYKKGLGRMSFYATNYNDDAFGYTKNLNISGTSDSTIIDNQGPTIELFMNDENFVYGGTTDESPILIANLRDENGINTVGNGIGHDVIATIDGNTQKSANLNEYYEADLDSYQSGKVKYPYSKLTAGIHTLNLKAWDVFNNSSEEHLEFVVAESEELAIKNIFNYPNPFTTHTDFYFEHNQAGQMLEVSIQIFTVSGKLVKTIEQNIISDGFRSEPIAWNGKDDYEDPIGRGVYIYKISVRDEEGEIATEFQKLVLLK